MTRSGSVPPGRRSSPTRHDVALLAGVSDAVVSYTLSGRSPVAADTAERVRAAIAKLGYRPNQSARALKSGSSRTLALISPAGEDGVFANPFFAQFTSSVTEKAQLAGYAVFVCVAGPGPTGIRDVAVDCAARQVDGVLVFAGPEDPRLSLDPVGIPWVQLNATHRPAGMLSVGSDLYAGSFAVTEHLIEHGHTQIGFLGEGPGEPRHDAWQDACHAHKVYPAPYVPAAYSHLSGYLAGQQIAATESMPPALVTASDMIGLGVIRALNEHRIAIPTQTALASIDGSWESEYSWPSLTSYQQPIEAMAQAAVDKLLGNSAAESHDVFRGSLVLRASCGSHEGDRRATARPAS